jgi:hypothetical protein
MITVNGINTVLGQPISLGIGSRNKGVACARQKSKATALSADPDFTFTSADGISKILVQSGDAHAPNMAALQPVETTCVRRKPGSPFGVDIDRAVVF